MTPKERLIKYFSFVRRQSKLTASEFTEMCNLEISLIDDMDDFEKLKQKYKDKKDD